MFIGVNSFFQQSQDHFNLENAQIGYKSIMLSAHWFLAPK